MFVELHNTITITLVSHERSDRAIAMLHDPVIDGKEQVRHVGRESFGIVRAQMLRGILVAIKEFLPRSLKTDVIHTRP